MEHKEDKNIINAAGILLLSIANADHNIEKEEIRLIKEIMEDFFSLQKEDAYEAIENAIIDFKKSTSFFQYSQILNKNFSYQDKLDFIFCIFEVAYVDKELHFMEQHLIKNIEYFLYQNNTSLFITFQLKLLTII